MDFPRKTIACGLLAVVMVAAWLAVPDAAQPDRHRSAAVGQAATRPTAGQPATGYVGEATCLTCHAAQSKGYHDSAHARASNPDSPIAGLGCESCHGPGRAHVDASGDRSKIKTFTAGTPPEAANAQCLDCHTKGGPALWEGSQHDALHVPCTSCHSIHAPQADRSLLKAGRQVEICEPCHRSEVQKLRRSAHMPIGQGVLDCSSCHNPHGSTGEKLLKAGNTVNETCQNCHAEKRGPFLWEHAPVVESCTTCHDPHGSTNDRMLVAKEPFLCQRCHVTSQHPASVYDMYALTNSTIADRMYGRSCAACHQNVHGSNAPSGKAFLR